MAVIGDSESQTTLLLGNEFILYPLARWMAGSYSRSKRFSRGETFRHRQESSHGFLILQPVTESSHRLRCVIFLFEGASFAAASSSKAQGETNWAAQLVI